MRGHISPSPTGGRRGWGPACSLLKRCACFQGGSRVSARQPTPFLLPRQKKWGKEKASLAGGLSGETHCAPASLRSDSRRKFEFLCRSTPVLQLACGVAQALRLELPLPQAGEEGSAAHRKGLFTLSSRYQRPSATHTKTRTKSAANAHPVSATSYKNRKELFTSRPPVRRQPTYSLPLRPWPGNTKTCADCGCC